MKKILIIEDESSLQDSLSESLTQDGYKTISALNGEVGLKMAIEENPDLILLDLVLPKMNGFDVLKNLKSNQKTKSIPVIVLTNLEDINDIEKVLELGATTYLVKANYSLEEITEKIKLLFEE